MTARPGSNEPLLLAVEDDPAGMEILVEYLSMEGWTQVLRASSRREALALFNRHEVDLVYLDVLLPDGDGIELTRELKDQADGFVPIILVTALTSTSDKVRGMDAGADDFITKPIVREELTARTRSHLRTKQTMDELTAVRAELAGFNHRLREVIRERTGRLDQALEELRLAKTDVEETRLEIMERLGMAAEYRDEETGFHVQRMSQYVFHISVALGLDEETTQLFRVAAPLHDLGKLGIGDQILRKPASLADDEYAAMKAHPIIGSRILANPRTRLLAIAHDMARSHHERWDGGGYPDGLAGQDIPLPARICAVADVFDALTAGRIYRPEAFPVDVATEEIREGSGTRFDPEVVDAFFHALPQILEDRERIGTL